jgi:hypothetical protein
VGAADDRRLIYAVLPAAIYYVFSATFGGLTAGAVKS